MIFFNENDAEASIIQYFFRSLHFEYGGMSGKLTGYKYQHAKDMIKWSGLKAKNYIPLLDKMFSEFRAKIK